LAVRSQEIEIQVDEGLDFSLTAGDGQSGSEVMFRNDQSYRHPKAADIRQFMLLVASADVRVCSRKPNLCEFSANTQGNWRRSYLFEDLVSLQPTLRNRPESGKKLLPIFLQRDCMKGNLYLSGETRVDDIQSVNLFVNRADGIPDSNTSGQRSATTGTSRTGNALDIRVTSVRRNSRSFLVY
jgi:hypothetical protein